MDRSTSNNNNMQNVTRQTAGFIIIILGFLVVFAGIGLMFWSIYDLSVLIAGQYMTFSLVVILIGIAIIYFGNKYAHSLDSDK